MSLSSEEEVARQNALIVACKSGQLEEVRQILADPLVDPSVNDDNAI